MLLLLTISFNKLLTFKIICLRIELGVGLAKHLSLI